MIHPAAKNKIKKATFVVFILFSLAFLFSTGGESSIISIILMSVYAGLVISAIFFVLSSILAYLITLLSNWLNTNKKGT